MSDRQFIYVPTIGLIPADICLIDNVANRPTANGTRGFFYAKDEETLYLDTGAWTRIVQRHLLAVVGQPIILHNGLNSNIAIASSYVKVTGPTAAFSVGGFEMDIRFASTELILYNSEPQTMTMINEDPSTLAGNRIRTLTGADFVGPAASPCIARFIYDGFGATGAWVMESIHAITSASSSYEVVQDEGTALIRRANLNFVGGGVTATDDPANLRTNVTIPGSSGLWDIVSKPSDQAVINSTTLTDDTVLHFGMAVNTKYRVRATIFVDSTQTANFKFAFTTPAGATLERWFLTTTP